MNNSIQNLIQTLNKAKEFQNKDRASIISEAMKGKGDISPLLGVLTGKTNRENLMLEILKEKANVNVPNNFQDIMTAMMKNNNSNPASTKSAEVKKTYSGLSPISAFANKDIIFAIAKILSKS